MIELVHPIQKINYSRNFPDIYINSDANNILFFLSKFGEPPLIAEEYDMPPNGQSLRISLKDLLHRELQNNLPDFAQIVSSHPNVMQSFTLTCREDDSSPLYMIADSMLIIKGIAYKSRDVDVEEFLFQNILSLRPEISYIYDFEPIFLSFYQPVTSLVKVDIRFKDETTTTLNYATIQPLLLQSVNVSYGNIQQLVSQEIVAYDVYIVVGLEQKTNKFRFVLKDFDYQRESFVYTNRLGGWDSISFIGSNEEISKVESSLAFIHDKNIQYDSKISRSRIKNLGHISSEEFRLQIIDFLLSDQKYVLEHGQLIPIVTNQTEASTSRGDLNNISFEYQFAQDVDQFTAIDRAKKFITLG